MADMTLERKCEICRATGFAASAVLIGLITWGLFERAHPVLAIIGFLLMLAVGLWAVRNFCGLIVSEVDAHSSWATTGDAYPVAPPVPQPPVPYVPAKVVFVPRKRALRPMTVLERAAEFAYAPRLAPAPPPVAPPPPPAPRPVAVAGAAVVVPATVGAPTPRPPVPVMPTPVVPTPRVPQPRVPAPRFPATMPVKDAVYVPLDPLPDPARPAPAPVVSMSAEHEPEPSAAPSNAVAGPRGDDPAPVLAFRPLAASGTDSALAGGGSTEVAAPPPAGSSDEPLHWSAGSVASGAAGTPAPFAGVQPTAPLADADALSAPVGAWTYRPAATGGAPTRPAGLPAARNGHADDLKLIKGIGPKLEAMLHGLGYFHFDQIAGWSEAEIAWVNDNLEGFKGRVTREGWVDQARGLMRGGSA